MLRILGMVIGIFCTATVLTVTLTLAYCWSLGNLNRTSRQDIVAILKGEIRSTETQPAETDLSMTSYDQMVTLRTEKVLNLSVRESELAILKQSINDQTNFVLNERRMLEQLKKTFREELDAEREKITSESVSQARGILVKMEPESAVEKLLSLGAEDAVILMRGLPEKEAARILDQFRQRIAGKNPDQRIEKAEEIYKAIYEGAPLMTPVDSAQQAMQDFGGGEPVSR